MRESVVPPLLPGLLNARGCEPDGALVSELCDGDPGACGAGAVSAEDPPLPSPSGTGSSPVAEIGVPASASSEAEGALALGATG